MFELLQNHNNFEVDPHLNHRGAFLDVTILQLTWV